MGNILRKFGIVSDGILNVSPREAFELVKSGALLIDAREENLRSPKLFDLPGVICIPKSKIVEEFEKLRCDKFLIFADTVGLRSKEVVIFLRDKKFKKIANMVGGIVDWERDGFPVTTDISLRLSGSCMCQLKPREGRGKVKV
jgi:rhodanese-related sulfurtransferase